MPNYMKKMESQECVGPSCMGCSSANCYAEGGRITETGYEKGVNKGRKLEGGKSYAGAQARGEVHSGQSKEENQSDSKETHRKTLSEMQSMKKPNLYAEGGEVGVGSSGGQHEEDEHEIHGMLGEELMGAMERKDHKAVMQCIEACVRNCMNKGDME